MIMAHMKIVGKDSSSPHYQERLKLAMKAYEKGCVIFSQDTKKWYTPREFLDSDEEVRFTRLGLDNYANHTMMYPASAIGFHLEAITAAEGNLRNFMERLLNAYDIHPKKPK